MLDKSSYQRFLGMFKCVILKSESDVAKFLVDSYFKHKDSFSNDSVICEMKDSRGFIWEVMEKDLVLIFKGKFSGDSKMGLPMSLLERDTDVCF